MSVQGVGGAVSVQGVGGPVGVQGVGGAVCVQVGHASQQSAESGAGWVPQRATGNDESAQCAANS